ncbi:hypothetical protein MNBD_DELTA01-2002 [hydrothermal vent metagenome]|uniref:Cytochrome c n=1 Tax=hydrothermal vent metagenome TaxID=652676 RepID=A0A3B0R163_9ZZZZ
MKKILFLSLAGIFTLAFVTGCTLGMGAGTGGHRSGVSIGASTEFDAGNPDKRRELKLPKKVKVRQKAMMRRHMQTLADITRAISGNDLQEAGTIASERLGWNEKREKKCKAVSKKINEPEFLEFGMAVHKKADELAGYAFAGDKDKTLLALSELINRCNGCHKVFRH